MDKLIGPVAPLPVTEPPSPALLSRDAKAMVEDASGVERAKFKKAATEFESFFIFYMLKTMRQAVPKSGLLDTRHADTFLSLLDQEVAGLAAKRGGFGLAKALENQLFPAIQRGPSSSLTDRPIVSADKEGS
jgi:flagellar protein FlgJ